MKYLRFILLLLGTSALLTACLEAPKFGDPPRLTGIEVYLIELQEQQLDSLVVQVDFEDGDGDLGLNSGEGDINQYLPVPNPDTGGPWVYNSNNLDPRLPPFSFRLYEETILGIDLEGKPIIGDTIRADYNEAYYNYNITLYTKENGQYKEYDPLLQSGSPPLGGRFPPLRDNFSVDRPLKGTIKWGTKGFYMSTFGGDTLRIDVTIRDRAGNVSNVITKEDFVLSDPDIIRSDQNS
jgi:hypothetical protein